MDEILSSRGFFLVAITVFCGALVLGALQARATGDPESLWVPLLVFPVLMAAVFVVQAVGKTLEGGSRGDGKWRRWEWLQFATLLGWVFVGLAMLRTGYTTYLVAVFTAMGVVGVAGMLYLGRLQPRTRSTA